MTGLWYLMCNPRDTFDLILVAVLLFFFVFFFVVCTLNDLHNERFYSTTAASSEIACYRDTLQTCCKMNIISQLLDDKTSFGFLNLIHLMDVNRML